MGIDDIAQDWASTMVSKGITELKAKNPKEWASFKATLKGVHEATGALMTAIDDDKVSSAEVKGALRAATNYGAARAVQDIIWCIFKHVKG